MPESASWETIAVGLLRYAERPEYHGEIAEILGGVMARLFVPGRRADLFHRWERQGLHITPVNYYYPIPDTRALPDRLWDTEPVLPGLDLNDAVQLDLLRRHFPAYQAEYDRFPREPAGDDLEFFFDNAWFGGIDALVLYCMVRHFQPRFVLEIGSGFSTRVSLQAAAANGDTRLICIEPYPDDPARHAILAADHEGRLSVIPERVEEVGFGVFDKLRHGDILFIDSSHVSRIGGDVNYLVLDILPRLKPGVVVHFHDIFLPWEYPREWVVDKLRFFTEQYLLRAFLSLNPHYEIVMANHYLGRTYEPELKAVFPNSPSWTGESFWIRRKPL
jgi:predicted O-methyltransferase YrrM